MDITTFIPTAPPAASTEPGDLYCDLQSRTLWLGVAEAVDPAGSLLISDIAGTLAAIDAAEASAKSYTDTKLLSYAPLANPVFTGNPRAPTPASTDNDTTLATTAFVKSAMGTSSGAFVKGMIVMWSGAKTAVPAGWDLCDGGGGSPDLRDKFVIGAGNLGVGAVNPTTSVSTNSDGGHTPKILSHILSVPEIPAHSHPQIGTHNTNNTGVDHSHTVSVTGVTDLQGAHVHAMQASSSDSAEDSGLYVTTASSGKWGTRNTEPSTEHGHNVSASGNTGGATNYKHQHNVTLSGNTGNTGETKGHTHGAEVVNDHSHTITSLNLRNAIPYYALCYIIKL